MMKKSLKMALGTTATLLVAASFSTLTGCACSSEQPSNSANETPTTQNSISENATADEYPPEANVTTYEDIDNGVYYHVYTDTGLVYIQYDGSRTPDSEVVVSGTGQLTDEELSKIKAKSSESSDYKEICKNLELICSWNNDATQEEINTRIKSAGGEADENGSYTDAGHKILDASL